MPNYQGVWSLTVQMQNRTDWPTFDGTRGLFAGGSTGSLSNVIEFVVISTEGDATDFGDLSGSGAVSGASFSSTTRGVFAGGYTTTAVNEIQYVTIATEGNTSDFGDLSDVRKNLTGLSNATRGVTGGGGSNSTDYLNIMDYVTIASTGNATDFGDMSNNLSTSNAATSNSHGGLS